MVNSSMSLISSALSAGQKGMLLRSSNIANSSIEGNTAKNLNLETVISEGESLGVRIRSVTSNIDKNLEKELMSSISDEKYYETLTTYHSEIESIYGNVHDANSIHDIMTEVFQSLSSFSNLTSNANERRETVKNFERAVEKIQYTSTKIQELRVQVDKEIADSYKTLNRHIEKIEGIASGLYGTGYDTEARVNFESSLSQVTQKISEFLPITIIESSRDGITVESFGRALFKQSKRLFDYEPVQGVSAFIKDEDLNPVYLYDSLAGKKTNDIIVKETTSEKTNHLFGKGKLSALMKIRDEIIPNKLDILDSYSEAMKNELNRVHNAGSGYPPLQTMKGTLLTSRATEIPFESFSSEYKDGVSNGIQNAVGDDPVPPEYKDVNNRNEANIHFLNADGEKLEFGGVQVPPLLIPLETLETTKGEPGNANVQGIVQHINNYNKKLTQLNRLELTDGVGDTIINDIKLVTKDTEFTTGAGSNFELDFEFDNSSGRDIAVTSLSIVNITGNGATIPTANYEVYRKRDGSAYLTNTGIGPFTATEYENYYTLESGNVRRTGSNPNGPVIRLKDLPADNFPYTIDCAITIKEPQAAAGAEYTTTLSFTVTNSDPDDINGLINQHFSATSSTLANYAIQNPLFQGAYAGDLISATVVDTDNVSVPSLDSNGLPSTEKGLLNIRTSSTEWRFAIESLGSKNTSEAESDNGFNGASRGFSHYYGLNDLIIRNDDISYWESSKHLSRSLAIRENIIDNVSNFAAAKIVDGEVSIGNNENLLDFESLKTESIEFKAVGKFVSRNNSIIGYVRDIITDVTSNVNDNKEIFEIQTDKRESLAEHFQSLKGVDYNEEIVQMMTLEHIYSAQAKCLSMLYNVLGETIALLGR